MSTPNTNPLSYNEFIKQIASMAVVTAELDTGVMEFVDQPLQDIVPMMLNYAELRIQRDLDLLPSQTSNDYTLAQGVPVLKIPIDDFLTLQTFQIITLSGGTVVKTSQLTPVSKEFIQNCYSGAANAGTPSYYAMIGDDFGDGADTFNKVLLGPPPNYAYTVRVSGTIRVPSLFKYASAGIADTNYTWISAYLPDMLIMASMIYVSAFQRNFSATSDSADMGLSYEKAYQALRLGGIPEENRKKAQASGWSPYSTPTAATPTR